MKTNTLLLPVLASLLATLASCTKSSEQVDQRVATLQAERDQLAAELDKAKVVKADIEGIKTQISELAKAQKSSATDKPASTSDKPVLSEFPAPVVVNAALIKSADSVAQGLKGKIEAQTVEAFPGAVMVPLRITTASSDNAVVEAYFKRVGDSWEPIQSADQLAAMVRKQQTLSAPGTGQIATGTSIPAAPQPRSSGSGGIGLGLVRDGGQGGQPQTQPSSAPQPISILPKPSAPLGGMGGIGLKPDVSKSGSTSAPSSGSPELPAGTQPIQGEAGEGQISTKQIGGKTVIQLPFGK